MDLQVKVLVVKSRDPSLTPGSRTVEGKKPLQQRETQLHTCTATHHHPQWKKIFLVPWKGIQASCPPSMRSQCACEVGFSSFQPSPPFFFHLFNPLKLHERKEKKSLNKVRRWKRDNIIVRLLPFCWGLVLKLWINPAPKIRNPCVQTLKVLVPNWFLINQ